MPPAPEQASKLAQLPNELKTLVFLNLPDLDSAHSLAFVNHDFYSVYQADATTISRHVLQNLISQPTLDEAIMIYSAELQRSPGWSATEIASFLEQDRDQRTANFMKTCSPHDVHELVQLYLVIHELSTDYATDTLALAIKGWSGAVDCPQSVPTETELTRIQLTLYHFELYYLFYGDPEQRQRLAEADGHPSFGWDPPEPEIMWNYFAPWEIEQFACLYDELQEAMADGTCDSSADDLH